MGSAMGQTTLRKDFAVSGADGRYVLDTLGLKMGLAIFATAWSIISMAHGLATNWQTFAVLRGLLGFAEGSANPAGMKATALWFPARERGFAGGVYNIGFGMHDHNITTRGHHVSFVKTIGFGAKADFQAVKLP